MTSIGPGPESVDVQLYAPAPTGARWDRSQWGGGLWASPSWQSVDCDVVEASFVRGVTDEAGVLSQSGSGPMDLSTLDPKRELDPSNANGPFFGSIAPGAPMRLVGGTAGAFVPVWTGWIDEATHDVAAQRGRVRCVDAIAQLAQSSIPEATVLPNTLRARVRAIVNAVGLGLAIPVDPEVAAADFVQNGGFEQLIDPAAQYPQPLAWTFGPNNSGYYSAGSEAGQTPADGGRVLSYYVGDAVARVCDQLIAGLVAGQTYTLTAYGCRTSGSGTARIYALETVGYTQLGAALSFGNAAPLAQQQTTFVAPANGQVVVRVDPVNLGPPVGSAFLFDAVSLVGPTGATLSADPPVAPFAGKSVAAWTAIQDAALDALTLVWLAPNGTIRFTSWGSLPDAVVSLGCAPSGDHGTWLGGLSTIVYGQAAAPIRNRVRAYSAGTTWRPYVDDAPSIARYGARALDVDRVVPDFATWSARILADRADAGLAVTLGEVRPYTAAELQALLDIGTTGPQIIRIADADHPPAIDDNVGIIGTAGRMTSAGWSFRYVTAIPRAEWDEVEPEPPEPPIPPPDPYHTETRVYVATSDALLALTSGGSKYGAGAASSLPVGVWSGWTYRAAIQLPSIPWTKIRRVVSATLRVTTSTQVRIGFGSSPTIEVQRITGSWSAGSSSSPSGGNAVVYPGPSTTSAGAVRKNLTTSQSTAQDIAITAIATAWAPSAIGGSAAPQRGVMLLPGSGSGADTTEVWPVEQGGAARPQLTLVVEVFD